MSVKVEGRMTCWSELRNLEVRHPRSPSLLRLKRGYLAVRLVILLLLLLLLLLSLGIVVLRRPTVLCSWVLSSVVAAA